MKKIFNNTTIKKIASIGLGVFIIILLVFAVNTSSISAQESESSDAGILNLTFDRMSRIGSLAINTSLISSYNLFRDINCMVQNYFPLETFTSNAKACLMVTGSSVFSNILVNQPGYVAGRLFVDEAEFSAYQFDIQTPVNAIGNKSMMVSSLQYPSPETLAPRDRTSQRGVCADNNGELVVCACTETRKIAYNGFNGTTTTPFEWDEFFIYDQNLTPIAVCNNTDDPNDYIFNSCREFTPGSVTSLIPQTPIAMNSVNPIWYTVVMDEPTPQWQRLDYAYNWECMNGDPSINCQTQPFGDTILSITDITIIPDPSSDALADSC